jgi:ankyrin repeat protein
MVLRISNHLPDSAAHSQSIFGLISQGDVEGVRTLLRAGAFSIYDHVGPFHVGPLAYAQFCDNIPIVQMLLQAGADPYQPEGVGMNASVASRTVSRFIRGKPKDVAMVREFPVDDYLEDFEFTPLHKVVMGILPLSLAEALSRPQFLTDINSATLNGQTALRIAALRNDLEACRLLIQAGAEVDASHVAGNSSTALHDACRCNHYDAATVLISLGASTTVKDATGNCALRGATLAHSDDTKLLELILDNGGDLNSMSENSMQPLRLAAGDGDRKLAQIRFLIDRGADLNSRDKLGITALLGAIMDRQWMTAGLLLERGADPGVRNADGQHALHAMAIHGMVEGFQELTKKAELLRCLDSQDQDESGKTARQWFNDKDPPPGAKLREAFEDFMQAVEGKIPGDDDGDIFVDALDHLGLVD